MQDAYRVVYTLLRGASLGGLLGNDEMTGEGIALTAIFVVFVFFFLVTFLVAILLATKRLDAEEIALEYYWEPKLAFVLTAGDLELDPSGQSLARPGGFYDTLASAWESLTIPWIGGTRRKEKNWYAASAASRGYAWLYGCVAVLIVPVWIVLGCVTLGLLWPPQVRRWIFRPGDIYERKLETQKGLERSDAKLYDVKKDMSQLKQLSYEKACSVEKELRELKDLLLSALKED